MTTAIRTLADLKQAVLNQDNNRNISLADEVQIRLLLECLNELRITNGKAPLGE